MFNLHDNSFDGDTYKVVGTFHFMTGDLVAMLLLRNCLKMHLKMTILDLCGQWSVGLVGFPCPLSYICPCIACSPWQVYPFIRSCPDPAKSRPIPEEVTGMFPVLMIQWSCLSLVRARAETTRRQHRNPVNGQYHILIPTDWPTPMRCNKRSPYRGTRVSSSDVTSFRR